MTAAHHTTTLQGIALRPPWAGAVLTWHCDGLNRPWGDYSHLLGRLLIAQAAYSVDREFRHPDGAERVSPLDSAPPSILGYVDCCEIVDNIEGDCQLAWARAGGAFIRFRDPMIFREPFEFNGLRPGAFLLAADNPRLAEAIASALSPAMWESLKWDEHHHAMMSRASAETPGKPDYGLRNMLPGKLAKAHQKRREM